jgi:MSHA pilin protein MshC
MAHSSRGFTLIELMAVLVILGSIAWVAVGRFSSSASYQLLQSRDNLIAALFIAQQQAMAQPSTAAVTLIIEGRNLNVSSSSSSTLNDLGISFPLTFPSSITITPTSLRYDKLGRTTPVDIQLSIVGNAVTVRVESSGFAYAL